MGLEVDVYDKRLELEYANLDIIRMPHIFSNISLTTKYGAICSQLFRFSRLCSSKIAFIIQSCGLILLLVKKGYSFKKIFKKFVLF